MKKISNFLSSGYNNIKNNNNLFGVLIIIATGIFAILSVKFVLSGQTTPDFTHVNRFIIHYRWIVLIAMAFGIIPWLIVDKKKEDKNVLFIVLAFYLLQYTPIKNLNFSWLPLGNIISSWEAAALIFTLWLAWPWKNCFYNFFENKKIYKISLWILIVGFFTLLFLQLGFRYYNYDIPGLDFGLFSQAIYNLSNFNWPYCSIRGFDNLWADHFHPIIIIVALFYKIIHSGYILILFQTLALSSCIWPIAKLAEKFKLPNALVVAISLFLIFQGGIYHANGFGFYPETVALPFLIWLVWSVFCAPKYIYLFLLLTLAGKENMGIYIISVLGVLAIFFKDIRKTVIIPLIVSAVWVIVSIKVIIPYFLGHEYIYFSYDQLGGNIYQVLATIITKPLFTFSVFLGSLGKLHTILATASPAAPLLFGGPFILFTLPFFAETGLSSRDIMQIWGFHYYAPVAVSVALALVFNANWLQSIRKWNKYVLSGLALALVLNLLIFVFNNKIYYINRGMINVVSDYDQRSKIKEIVDFVTIDNNLTYVAQDTLVAYLVNRKNIYEYPRNQDIADILVFTLDRSTFPFGKNDLYKEIKKLIDNKNYGVYKSNSEAIIFFKKTNNFKEEKINEEFLSKINTNLNIQPEQK